MNWSLIADAPLAVQVHLATVVPAFLLGTWLLFVSRKGGPLHRKLGYVYLAFMTITAVAAIFVRELRPGRFSWVHLFVPLTFWGVFAAIWRIRRRDVKGHQQAMLGLYLGGMLIAGGLAFAPGRLMYRFFFS